MKESIRNTKSRDQLSENSRDIREKMKMHRLKKYIFVLFSRYKMANISRRAWRKNGVEVIVFNGKKWLNERHIN